MSTDSASEWETEDEDPVDMPHSMAEYPHAQQSGFFNPFCKRCAAIPWADLSENPRYAADGDLRPVIEESREKLKDSTCRICRLLAMVKPFGWLKYIGCVPAAPGSHFKARLCFFPGEGVTPPKVAHPDLYGYLGVLENHEPDDTSKLQGMRVIDCETLLIIPTPKSCSYIALSYVWGPPSEFAEEKYEFPVLPERRSRTIEDAITVTKGLGFRYLWIDRYCINQNDPEHKMQQIRQMGAIYSSAELTIIAAAGDGPKHGLPGVSLPRQLAMPWGQKIGSITLVHTTVAAAEHVYGSTWAYRAWTFQEGYLSRRRLFFTNQTLLYVCNQDMKSDIIEEDYMPGDIDSHRTLHLFLPWSSPMPATDEWTTQSKNLAIAGRHMKAFSERRLTYASDGLNAILGILDQLAGKQDDPVYHIWGVPFAPYRRHSAASSSRKVSYEMALTWYHLEPCTRRAGFPSWTSVAWDGEMKYTYQDQMMVPDDTDVHVLSAEGSQSLDEYVSSGCALRDSGSSDAPARLELVQATTIPISMVKIDSATVLVRLQLWNELDIFRGVSLDEEGQSVEGAFLGVIVYRDYQSHRMLILIVTYRGDCYERVGLVIFDEDATESYKDGLGRVLDRNTGVEVTDVEVLKVKLERPVRFAGEEKQTIVLA